MKNIWKAVKIIFFVTLATWLFCLMGSCMMKQNEQLREEQRRDCVSRGGSYSVSQDKSGNPYRDFCIVK